MFVLADYGELSSRTGVILLVFAVDQHRRDLILWEWLTMIYTYHSAELCGNRLLIALLRGTCA